MIKASYSDKNLVIDILTKSFDNNRSVNYVVAQGRNRVQHIRHLMEYSFEICYLFGDVYLSDDKRACGLVLYPDKKKTTLRSILLNIKLILLSIGPPNIFKVLSREMKIKRAYPKDMLMYYLWFIGVHPEHQHTGIGSELVHALLTDAKAKDRIIFLETSVERNVPWYQKLGLLVYHELNLDYKIYFMKSL